jgi:hypothetical protein
VGLRPARTVQFKDAGSAAKRAYGSVRERAARPRTTKWAVSLAALTALALVASPVSARASYDPIGSGTTKLTLDKRFARLLAANDVELLAEGGARRRGRSFALSVSGGRLDPTKAKGVIEQEGTLFFQRGRLRVPLREIELKTKREPLIAKVGGSQLKLASAAKLGFERQGFGSEVSARGLRLTAKLATRLAKKLRLHGVFKPGQPLGTLRSLAQPQTLAILPEGRATIALDPAIVAKLNGLFVSINPIFPTELAPGNLFSVPIIRDGALSPDAALGTLRSAGAIEFLQQEAGQVFLTEFWFEMASATALAEIQIEPTPTFKGKLGQLAALAIGASSVSFDPKARTITLSAPLVLSAQTAAAFNEAIAAGQPIFNAGEAFGTLSFSAQTQ